MWKLDIKTKTLTNQRNGKRKGKWSFEPKSPPNYKIINLEGKTIKEEKPDGNKTKTVNGTFVQKTKMVDTFVQTILSIESKDKVKEKSDGNQVWKKGDVDSNGYFTLSDPSSGKFISSISANELALKGKAYCISLNDILP